MEFMWLDINHLLCARHYELGYVWDLDGRDQATPEISIARLTPPGTFHTVVSGGT